LGEFMLNSYGKHFSLINIDTISLSPCIKNNMLKGNTTRLKYWPGI
jgi:hypothetical protein